MSAAWSDVEHLDVLGISAGLSGIDAGRMAHVFPRQGSRAAWRAHQSYRRDYWAMKRGDVIDAGLELSNPSAMMSQTRRKTSA
jgi:hypothetical protein